MRGDRGVASAVVGKATRALRGGLRTGYRGGNRGAVRSRVHEGRTAQEPRGADRANPGSTALEHPGHLRRSRRHEGEEGRLAGEAGRDGLSESGGQSEAPVPAGRAGSGDGEAGLEQAVEQAKFDLEGKLSSLAIQGKSTSVETEQADLQVGFNKWDLEHAKQEWKHAERQNKEQLVNGQQVEQADRTVRSKEFSLTVSQNDLEQKKNVNEIKQSQSTTDIDTAKFNLELAKRRVTETARESADRVKRTKEQLDKMLKDLASGEVRAACDGTILLTKILGRGRQWRAAYGDRGGPDQGGFGGVTDPAKLMVFLHLGEAVAYRVKVGQEVVVTAEGVPGRRFKGKVASIGTVAHTVHALGRPDGESHTSAYFDVKVTLLDIDPKVLRPGMKAEATFVLDRLSQGPLGAAGRGRSSSGQGRFRARATGGIVRGAGGGNRGTQ